MIEPYGNQDALAGIRHLAFELIKNSPDQERKINIEDLGDYCSIQLTIRVMGKEFRKALDRAKEKNPGVIGEG
ncbi:MAG: hypothetical protein H7A32_04755 [Deltaproteobacteria bacterium]|nr:hypothetical protein [Deltaproteobacteria bacterium]